MAITFASIGHSNLFLLRRPSRGTTRVVTQPVALGAEPPVSKFLPKLWAVVLNRWCICFYDRKEGSRRTQALLHFTCSDKFGASAAVNFNQWCDVVEVEPVSDLGVQMMGAFSGRT